MHASASVLKPLNTIYHSALRFITGVGFWTHHCTLYHTVGWFLLDLWRKQHYILFIYKALLAKLPQCVSSLLSMNFSNDTTISQDFITLKTPRCKTEWGKTASSVSAPLIWKEFQDTAELSSLVSYCIFKELVVEIWKKKSICDCSKHACHPAK